MTSIRKFINISRYNRITCSDFDWYKWELKAFVRYDLKKRTNQ